LRLDTGTLILVARLACGLSQAQFAQQLGVSDSCVRRWEVHEVSPPRLAVIHTRELLKRPLYRRRVYLWDDAELFLRLGGFVEPIDTTLAHYLELRRFVRELGMIGTATQAVAS
jgi:transcriptional regulator with XRE-family HTH domain